MEIKVGKILQKGVKLQSIKEFADSHNVTPQAVGYLITQDKLDYIKIGSERMILLNKKSKDYNPNPNVHRKERMEL